MKKGVRARLVILSIFVFFLFSLLIVQFYKIQITQNKRWQKVANSQHYFTVTEPFIRGSFYSNTSIQKGHPENKQRFVIDIQKYHLHIDPKSIPNEYKKEIAAQLIAFIGVKKEDQEDFHEELLKNSRNRRLALFLDRQTKDEIFNWWREFSKKKKIIRNTLFFVKDYQRSYPFGKLLGQVLHTIRDLKEEKTKRALPTGGLELHLNSYLTGKLGKRRLMRSPKHSFELGEVIKEPENGADVYLTINHNLQAIAEEELEKGVKKSQAKGGWAVMMDPVTGEILAMAQYPFFYPESYQEYFLSPERIEDAKVKAITEAREPGSVMKPVTVAIALQANHYLKNQNKEAIFYPEEKISTSNGNFPGRRKLLKDVTFHRSLNMYMALQKSSNIYMGRLVDRIINRLGNEWYRDQLHRIFEFSKPTGVELPAESFGVLPELGKKHSNGKLEWSVATPYSLAMGYNIQVTSLQMLKAYALFANGGYLVQPTLVKEIIKKEKNELDQVLVDNITTEKIRNFPKVLEDDVVKEVVKGLRYVTKKGGYGHRGNIPGYTEAGKTGTARKIVNGQYSTEKYLVSCVGFAPVENPAFVLVVSIDEPKVMYIPGVGYNNSGGVTAAPIFREIGKRTLEFMGVAPDDPYGYFSGDPRFNPDKAIWLPEVEKLNALYKKWNEGL